MRLDWLADVARGAGLEVFEQSGWRSRGYDFAQPIHGVICHHTATPASAPGDYPSLNVVTYGRSDLAGPLSQYGLGRSGKVYVIAAGRANHAGSGSYPGLDGNYDTIGIEAENPGTGAPWPSKQVHCYHVLCAAIAEHVNFPTSKVIGHKEWTTRKPDPHPIDMSDFRRSVQAIREDDVAQFTDKEAEQLRELIRISPGGKKGWDNWAKDTRSFAQAAGWLTESSDPDELISTEREVAFNMRLMQDANPEKYKQIMKKAGLA